MRAAMFILVAELAFPSAGTQADDPPQSWEYIGQIQASAAVEVRPRVTGNLTRVVVEEGDAVAKGEVLVEIDPRPYRLALEAAQARLKEAEAKLQLAKIETANAKHLLDSNFVSRVELDLKTAAEAAAEAALAVATVEMEQAELILSWTRITAPFDGRVSHVQATEGGLVVADQMPILTVVSTDALHVAFNVPESRLLELRRAGLADPEKLDVAVGFAGEARYLHKAKLDLIEPVVDQGTGTVQFRATVSDPQGLLSPGMSARIRLTAAAQ